METLTSIVTAINNFVWGPPMLVLVLGTGLFLQLRLKLMPILRIVTGFRMVWKGRKPESGAKGEITPYAALMTALAATVGTGNIAGVATAIAIGGPGALFWMWMTALVGMATKYAEVLLSVHFRETNAHGEHMGGPMFAIKNGLGQRWAWLGAAFALFGGLAGFGIGNMVQSNSIAAVLTASFGISPWVSGVVLMVLTGFVLLGGVKRIGAVAEKLVPAMCIGYVVASLIVLGMYADQIPAAFALIFKYAFTPLSATGGFAGATIMLAMRYGVARGIFSNEAGLGTAGIAQAAGQTKSAAESGLVGMMGTFIDTIVVCTMTGLVLIITGAWNSGLTGAELTSSAFATAFPGFGQYLLAIALAVFAFTTILGWAYYGEKCWAYLFGSKVEVPYRVLWTLFVMVGAVTHLDFVWLLADTLNAFMAFPNLVSLVLLSPVVSKVTNDYFADKTNAGTLR
ncbi:MULTISPECIES: sodium:alanine symporter family protein [unclassified Polaromonas]|uniref:alanine/glycine:cation symporter family protein n=1 Tax=unclassified Polaromonas TaxID=2638319 RepID=UPI001A1A8BB0|nr:MULTISPECIES: sodium:alanine symporter family protein [unclassified Polaromonas]MBG6072832.1 AGCS family alanine or glycine:cation symporter [Polaromonas sp. CG_9.7]MBG6114837.1 AGCS family alanine or glycine:cation symporter [Polaromonas sp. CG_9.2]MDH6184683.1 AGCS family alanine or glycine:cation symporter [Polaromonas sp. CG_23.6]